MVSAVLVLHGLMYTCTLFACKKKYAPELWFTGSLSFNILVSQHRKKKQLDVYPIWKRQSNFLPNQKSGIMGTFRQRPSGFAVNIPDVWKHLSRCRMKPIPGTFLGMFSTYFWTYSRSMSVFLASILNVKQFGVLLKKHKAHFDRRFGDVDISHVEQNWCVHLQHDIGIRCCKESAMHEIHLLVRGSAISWLHCTCNISGQTWPGQAKYNAHNIWLHWWKT